MIDLHLHLDGSLTVDDIWFLAKEQGISLPVTEKSALWPYVIAPENCKSLIQYLTCFDVPLRVLQSRSALRYATSSLLSRLSQQGLLYAEIRFAPQSHQAGGLSQEEALGAVLEGLRFGRDHLVSKLEVGLILCMMRGHDNGQENLETLRLAERYLGAGVCGVDLAGPEALYPTGRYQSLFAEVKGAGVPFTIHAGEAGGPDDVRAALSFGAKRIGHGVRSLQSPALMQELADRGTVLELCPTSNLQTKAVSGTFPLQDFLAYGINVTINTDNMLVSNTTLEGEFECLETGCGLQWADRKRLITNAVKGSFLTPVKQRQLLTRTMRRLETRA